MRKILTIAAMALKRFGRDRSNLFFVFVLPMNKLQDRRARQLDEPTELTNEEKMVQLLEQIAAK